MQTLCSKSMEFPLLAVPVIAVLVRLVVPQVQALLTRVLHPLALHLVAPLLASVVPVAHLAVLAAHPAVLVFHPVQVHHPVLQVAVLRSVLVVAHLVLAAVAQALLALAVLVPAVLASAVRAVAVLAVVLLVVVPQVCLKAIQLAMMPIQIFMEITGGLNLSPLLKTTPSRGFV